MVSGTTALVSLEVNIGAGNFSMQRKLYFTFVFECCAADVDGHTTYRHNTC